MATAQDLRRIALSLEGASEAPHMDRAAFRVARIFVTLAADEKTANFKFTPDEQEFKCMLAEAHRSGAVILANADLKDKKNIKELESSAILYKNTVWHFVRVED